MKPSVALRHRKEAIRKTVRRFRVRNPRVFGSVLDGNDAEGRILDLLVDSLPETKLFDLGGLQLALEDLLGVSVDVVTPGDLPARIREVVVSEARSL